MLIKAWRNQRALGKWQGTGKTTGRWGKNDRAPNKTTGCSALSFRPSKNPAMTWEWESETPKGVGRTKHLTFVGSMSTNVGSKIHFAGSCKINNLNTIKSPKISDLAGYSQASNRLENWSDSCHNLVMIIPHKIPSTKGDNLYELLVLEWCSGACSGAGFCQVLLFYQ